MATPTIDFKTGKPRFERTGACFVDGPVCRVARPASAAVKPTSAVPPFRGLTGGVYKAQEHIHRGVADPRLLAIPASRGRVAARDLNWGVFFGICWRSRVCFPLCTPL